MAEQVNQDQVQELATGVAEAKATKSRKTPEEKKAAKRKRARARRLKKRATELGLTQEEILSQRKARKEAAAARKAEKKLAKEPKPVPAAQPEVASEAQLTPLQEAESTVEVLIAKRNGDGLSDEEKKALKAAQDKVRYYKNKEAA